MTRKPQHLEALDRANVARLGAAAVRREVRDETLSVGDALFDPRADTLHVVRLLTAQLRWGPSRATALLGECGIGPNRRVRELTDRQKHVICHELEARRAA